MQGRNHKPLRRSNIMCPELHIHRQLWELSDMYMDVRDRESRRGGHERPRERRGDTAGPVFEHNS